MRVTIGAEKLSKLDSMAIIKVSEYTQEKGISTIAVQAVMEYNYDILNSKFIIVFKDVDSGKDLVMSCLHADDWSCLNISFSQTSFMIGKKVKTQYGGATITEVDGLNVRVKHDKSAESTPITDFRFQDLIG